MFAVKRTIPRALGRLLTAACLLVVVRTVSFALSPWSGDLHQPSLYIIEGYLDRAPATPRGHLCARPEQPDVRASQCLGIAREGVAAAGSESVVVLIGLDPAEVRSELEEMAPVGPGDVFTVEEVLVDLPSGACGAGSERV